MIDSDLTVMNVNPAARYGKIPLPPALIKKDK